MGCKRNWAFFHRTDIKQLNEAMYRTGANVLEDPFACVLTFRTSSSGEVEYKYARCQISLVEPVCVFIYQIVALCCFWYTHYGYVALSSSTHTFVTFRVHTHTLWSEDYFTLIPAALSSRLCSSAFIPSLSPAGEPEARKDREKLIGFSYTSRQMAATWLCMQGWLSDPT